VKQGAAKNGGMGNQEWAAVVNRDGEVCAIVFSGSRRSDQWPGSRVIAAEKASTANALSGRDYALSTVNIYAAAQPGQSLYSLATGAPPNPQAAFWRSGHLRHTHRSHDRQSHRRHHRVCAGGSRCTRVMGRLSAAWD